MSMFIKTVTYQGLNMKKALVASAALVMTIASQAQTFEQKPYFGFEVGSATVEDATGPATSSLVAGLGGTATATQDSTIQSYKLIGGYKYSENLDFEVGYLKTSSLDMNFSGVSRGNVAYSGGISLKLSGYEYAAILRPNVDTGWNNAYLKIGGHKLDGDLDINVRAGNVSAADSASTSGNGTLFGLGYDHPLDKKTSLRFALTEYKKIAGEDITARFVSVGAIYKY